MNARKKLMGALVDSQKRLARVRGTAEEIIKVADRLEEEATSDVRCLRRTLRKAQGPRREIAEAGYLEALDRRRRAGQAGTLARRTLARN